jgi:hypothetical protein
MAVQTSDIKELLDKNNGLFTQQTEGEHFRIRVSYSYEVDYLTRKYVANVLRSKGFEQVGNATSWVRAAEKAGHWRQTFLAEDKD